MSIPHTRLTPMLRTAHAGLFRMMIPALRSCGRQRLVKVTYDGFPVVEDGDGDAKDKEILHELLVVGALKNE